MGSPDGRDARLPGRGRGRGMGESVRRGSGDGSCQLQRGADEPGPPRKREGSRDLQLQRVSQSGNKRTNITTGKPQQVVYGERAIDLVFGFIGVGDFNLGDFFGEKTVNRITTRKLSSIAWSRFSAKTLNSR